MSLIFKLEAEPGDGIEEVANEAVRVSNALVIPVQFMFNDITCFVRPNTSADTLIKNFYKEMAPPPVKIKFVRSW